MIRRPPRSTLSSSSAASDVYKRQYQRRVRGAVVAMEEGSVETLLQTASFPELLAIEKRVSREVGAQQNNLRLLVGESYKDLIESANSVIHMQLSVQQLGDKLRGINAELASEKFGCAGQQVAAGRTEEDSGGDALEFAGGSVMVAPEQIWDALEQGRMAEAARVWVGSQEQWEGLAEYERLKSLAGQSMQDTLTDLKMEILHSCKRRLMEPFQDPGFYSDCLSGISALDPEYSNPTAVLDLLLDSRSGWISHCLSQLLIQPHQTAGWLDRTKQAVSHTIKSLQDTVHHLAAIFIHPPSHRFEIASTAVTSRLDQWLSDSIMAVTAQFKHLLHQVTGGHVLAELQQVAISSCGASPELEEARMDNVGSGVGTCSSEDKAWVQSWVESSAVQVLGSLWSRHLESMFEERACEVINLGFEKLDISSHLDAAADRLEAEHPTESIGQIVQQVCSSITSQMKAVLQDVQSLFLHGHDSHGSETSTPSTQESTPSTQERLANFFSNKCSQHLQTLAASATVRVKRLQAAGADGVEGGVVDEGLLDQALLLGGVCGALASGALWDLLGTGIPAQTTHSTAALSLQQGGQQELEQCHISAYSLWVQWTVEALSRGLVGCRHDSRRDDLLTHWNQVSVDDEETERVSIPTQLSTTVMTYLFQLCQQAIRIGASAVGATVMTMLQRGALQGALSCYQQDTWLGDQVGQPALLSSFALQAIFDLRFLHMVLVQEPDDPLGVQTLDLIQQMKLHVDPIEYEMCHELLAGAVQTCYTRVGTLLGPIATQNSKLAASLNPAVGAPPNTEQANVLKLSSVVGRFNMLATQMFPPPPAFTLSDDPNYQENLDLMDHNTDEAYDNESPRSPTQPKGMVESLLTSHATSFSDRLTSGFSATNLSEGWSKLLGNS
eukprot:TRINITY_DN3857_c0_g1_i2.p1 TRINITY_DN3857_c0_g1~~TRINITY_DN3857_c0_g1_i2.p1  ORF type:complete len:897 (+),score=231.09 TRINITY_DN3857_c0_g1_i2:114-2804(+)